MVTNMKFAVGFQLYSDGSEPFSRIVETYKEHISEVFFAWQDISTGRSNIATRHGYTDWSAQARTEQELRAIKQIGVKLDLLFNGNCYGQYALSEKLYQATGAQGGDQSNGTGAGSDGTYYNADFEDKTNQ